MTNNSDPVVQQEFDNLLNDTTSYNDWWEKKEWFSNDDIYKEIEAEAPTNSEGSNSKENDTKNVSENNVSWPQESNSNTKEPTNQTRKPDTQKREKEVVVSSDNIDKQDNVKNNSDTETRKVDFENILKRAREISQKQRWVPESKTKEEKDEKTLDKDMPNEHNSNNENVYKKQFLELQEQYKQLEKEKNDLSRKLKNASIDIEDNAALIDALREKATQYKTEAETAKLDAQRASVPQEFEALLRYYQDTKDENEKYAKQSEYRYKHELKTLAEKAYGRSLDPYVWGATSLGNEAMSGGGMAQFDTNTSRNNNRASSIDSYIEYNL